MSEVGNARTNSETDFNIVESDLPLLLVRARIAEATGLPTAIMELSKVLHYSAGQQFGLHYDFIDPITPALAAEVAERGQRMATLLIYLNDEFAGGETSFPEIGLCFKGKIGDALFFANVDTEGRPDPRTLHAGLAPATGENGCYRNGSAIACKRAVNNFSSCCRSARLSLQTQRNPRQHGLSAETGNNASVLTHGTPNVNASRYTTRAQKYIMHAHAVVALVIPSDVTTSTSGANTTRFSTEFACAFFMRCAQAACGFGFSG